MSTQLSVSQGNALVYSTLSAFFLVGLYAGYRCKTERDFFSGIRTQGAFALCLNWIASSQYCHLRPASLAISSSKFHHPQRFDP
ncbi:unnamed protein product [Tilletia controversa]|uniref:Uncharacterized protein n=2 Tax=Tilletia TaxID=13289 RepID=A0A177V6E9_9BASI|nr:hypothetical protein CF336_g1004 [Tilletia laevis]KAE8205715.1 hypothetical protein CF328_g325 [Tilletia controversa]KAE8265755.1 hypothetical protein A4X03_0g45 [Tilletia caries]KAE8208209.1 hypothetical protein CF335_g579 [Tilletia laevis]CAD6917881.1 unnamed protein product [Tilletia controversa]